MVGKIIRKNTNDVIDRETREVPGVMMDVNREKETNWNVYAGKEADFNINRKKKEKRR